MPFAGRTPAESVAAAVRAIGRIGRLGAVSRLFRSPAWPDPREPAYVNAVLRLEAGPEPSALLAALQGVEAGFGRRRAGPNAARTLDLDIIDHHGAVSAGGPWAPVLPHPRAVARDFVLLPLRDVAPDWRDPQTGATVDALLARLAPWTATPIEPAPDIALQRLSRPPSAAM